MVKFLKDVFLGEPVVSTALISLGFTSWLAALTQYGEPVPMWLAIAAPMAAAFAGYYGRKKSSPLEGTEADHDE
jgi:hypothetical protein